MSHLENQMDNMFHSGESEREKLIEELETLRAENANLKDTLTIAYMDGYAKAQEKIRGLEAENAKLIAERDDVLGRKRADELAENGDMYADVYCQIVDLIDPHVKRGFNDSGELPTSVVHSVEFLFEFWIQHKAERVNKTP